MVLVGHVDEVLGRADLVLGVVGRVVEGHRHADLAVVPDRLHTRQRADVFLFFVLGLLGFREHHEGDGLRPALGLLHLAVGREPLDFLDGDLRFSGARVASRARSIGRRAEARSRKGLPDGFCDTFVLAVLLTNGPFEANFK